MYSFPYFEPVSCSTSSSNCCFLTCIQISQEAGQVVWYSHLLKNFPEFVVVHRVKAFGLVNKAEVDAFMELFSFFNDPMDVGDLISGSSAFSKPSLNIWTFMVHCCTWLGEFWAIKNNCHVSASHKLSILQPPAFVFLINDLYIIGVPLLQL